MFDGKQLTGSQAIATALAGSGIETVFTLAGGHFLPTYEAIAALGATHVVAARHELGAGYMASGHALATGRPGVVFSGAPGPGATNLVTPVANAQADSIPLLVLTGQVDRRYLNRNILQYADNVGLFSPFCKSSLQAVSAAELPNLIATGLQMAASGRPGPVHIDLPQSLQAEKLAPVAPIRPAALAPGVPDIEPLLELLASSRRPAILAGHGVIRSGGATGLPALAKALGAPVATSRSGIGSIRSDDPASVGMLGFYGTDTARDAIAEADLVLVIGCALGEQTTFGWRPDLFAQDARVVQADIDPKQPNLVYPTDLALHCDAAALLRALEGQIADRQPWFGRQPVRLPAGNDASRGMSAADVLQSLNTHLKDDMLVSGDIGNHRLWICDQLDITRPERLLQSCEFDAMGFSLPAAIGAAVADPGRRVVSISGDGGFVHTMGEMAVMAELNLPVIAVVFVDGALGILRHQAEAMWGQDRYAGLAPIDFTTVAQGFGIASRAVDRATEIDAAMAWAFAQEGPALLSVTIDPEEIFEPLKSKIEQRKRDLLAN